MKATAIPPSDVRDYAKSRGWFMVREAIKDRLYVLNHPTHHRQIVLPMDKDVPDYEDAVRLSLEKLAETESVSVVKIQDRIFSLGRELRPNESYKEDTFIGTVERLELPASEELEAFLFHLGHALHWLYASTVPGHMGYGDSSLGWQYWKLASWPFLQAMEQASTIDPLA